MESHVKEEGMDTGSSGCGNRNYREQFNFHGNSATTTSSVDCTPYGELTMEFFRPMACQTGLLTNPHGSVKLFQGDTCVVAAVFGPTEVRLSKELPQRGAVDVLFRPKVTGMSQLSTPVMDPVLGERNMENILISIFETSIHLEDISGLGYNIIVHEFEDDGNLLSACINAITIALMDGGCSLRHTVAAVTMILTSDNKLIIDPSSTQLKSGYEVKLTYVISNSMEVLYTNIQGHASIKVLKIAQVKAYEAVRDMFKFFHFLTLKKNQQTMASYQRESITAKVKIEPKQEMVKEERNSFIEDGELSSESDH